MTVVEIILIRSNILLSFVFIDLGIILHLTNLIVDDLDIHKLLPNAIS